jgi:hypothetical protein
MEGLIVHMFVNHKGMGDSQDTLDCFAENENTREAAARIGVEKYEHG